MKRIIEKVGWPPLAFPAGVAGVASVEEVVAPSTRLSSPFSLSPPTHSLLESPVLLLSVCEHKTVC